MTNSVIRLAWFATIVSSIYGAGFDTQLFSDVAARNQIRESRLLNYSVTRTYQVTNAAGRIQGQSKVLVTYDRPKPKEFQILEEEGSRAVANMVFRPLMQHEAKASEGEAKRDTSIIPANYDVQLTGEEELDGRTCYVLSATPRRRDKELFEGKIWIDAEDMAIAQIEGQPARSPSFWVKNVHFVRRYQKVGDFWLPREDTSVSDVRIFGKHTLTIHYESYKIGAQAEQ
jgi:outer membrane lipoprotein-sorting protein